MRSWEKAGYELPEGVPAPASANRDVGVRLVDLNADGYLDLVFGDADRYGVHLWNKDVKPHLGWTRGWSQFVRSGQRRGHPAEPPSLVGAEVSVEDGVLIVKSQDRGTRRIGLKTLIAFDADPPKSVAEALKAFRLRPGFRIECIAAEPVVQDPISFDWDAEGRLWVVEMRDYPLGLDGNGKPGGKVKTLSDRDGDGVFESATPFLEGLPFPTSVMPWKRGALVATAPDLLYAEDTDGDGKADKTEVLLTGFHPGNQQHRFNGFEWGLDGWVYVANGDSGGQIRIPGSDRAVSISGRDLRFHPETREWETVSAQTQYARRRDDWGHWFGNNNPTWLWQVVIPEHYLRRNPKLAVKRVSKILANYPDSTRVFPISAAQVRPNQPWSLNHVTSGCSASPYRDELFGPDFADSVFICEPVHNVVHREVLVRDGSTWSSRRAQGEEKSEFLASADNWFRPTTVRTGPDGALYVADMYRLVLEHPEWISPEMQARLDLRAGQDKGRIYRIAPESRSPRAIPNLAALKGAPLAAAMDSPSGWQRDVVQRLLLERRDPETGGWLKPLLSLTHAPQVRVQALATLGLIGSLSVGDLETMLGDPHPCVRSETLRQSERFAGNNGRLLAAVIRASLDGDPAVRFQAAFSLGAWNHQSVESALSELAARDADDDWIRTAVLSSLRPESALFQALQRTDAMPAKAAPVLGRDPSSPDRAAVVASYGAAEQLVGDSQRGKAQFETLCASCHRMKGIGHEVGPDLAMVRTKPFDWLLIAILDPNGVVEARYRGWAVTLRNGETLEGLVSAETGNNIVLRQSGGVEHAVLRSEIASMEPLKSSLMPGGLETVLPPQGMADLVHWLRTP